MKTAFVFPGQGSQFVGMGHGMAESWLEKASQILGFDLKKICFEGSEDELKKTAIQQPAIFTVSVAACECLKSKGIDCEAAAGHSLGEYAALYSAGVLSFEEGVMLVHLRGKFMQEAVPAGVGAMAALLGGERKIIEEICQTIENVWPANFNCPGQIVISGAKEGVAAAGEKLKAAGVKRVIPLPVSAPFHCPLMRPAADKLAKELDKITLKNAKIPVVSNVLANYVLDSGEIKALLIKQVTHPVLWEDSVNKLAADGFTNFIEAGPGKVLSGLIKKTTANAEVKTYDEFSG